MSKQTILDLLDWLYLNTDLLKTDVEEAMEEQDFQTLAPAAQTLIKEWMERD